MPRKKGFKHSEETKKKIGDRLVGHKHSEETIKKIKDKSIFKKGHKPWNNGLPQPKKVKEKISKTNKKKGIKPKKIFSEKGKNHPRWNGGGYGYWKKVALSRDNYTCQKCGLRDEEIMEVDHILPKSVYPELKYDINNLMTLCPNCHRRKSIKERKNGIYGRKNVEG